MDFSLITSLQAEEREILAELRASLAFRRLEEVQRLLSLYAGPVPIGAGLDALLDGPNRPAAPRQAPQPTVIALHGECRA